jgi:hypothetical protein
MLMSITLGFDATKVKCGMCVTGHSKDFKQLYGPEVAGNGTPVFVVVQLPSLGSAIF